MAAHPTEGPAVVQEAARAPAPKPALGVKAEVKTAAKPEARGDDQDEHDDDEQGDVWESASLYEEILDEVEAFEYSNDGKGSDDDTIIAYTDNL